MQGESHHDRAPARPESRAGFGPGGARGMLDPYTQEALRRTEAAHAVADVLQYAGSPVRHGDVRAAVRGVGSSVAASSNVLSPSRLAPAYDFGQDAAPVNGHHAALPHGGSSSSGGQRGWYDRYDAFGREVKDHGSGQHQGAHGLTQQQQQQQQYALNAAVALVQNRQLRGQWPAHPPPSGGGDSHLPMPDGRHARQPAVERDDDDDDDEYGYESRAAPPSSSHAAPAPRRETLPPPPPSASAASTAAASLDDMPVTPGVGAAGRAASFEELLEAELAKQRDVGAPSEAPGAADPSTRSFLRKGARAARTAPAAQQQQQHSAVTRPESRASGRPAVAQAEAPRPARGEPGGGHTVQQHHPAAVDAKPNGGASLNSLSGGAPRPFLRRGQGIMATSVGARQRKEALAAATAAAEASRVGTGDGDVDEGRHRAPSRAEEHAPAASQPHRRHVPGAGIRAAPQHVAVSSDYGYPSDEEVADPDDGNDYDGDERHAGSSTFGGGASSTAGYEGPRLSVPSAAAAARYSASMPRPAVRSSAAGSAWDDDTAPWDDEEDHVRPSSDGAEPLHVLHLSGHGDSGAQQADMGSHAPAPAAQAAAKPRPAPSQAAARHNTASEASDSQATCALVQTLFFDDKAKRAAIAAQHMHPARPQSAMGHKKGSAAAHAAAQSAAGGDATVAARLAALEAEMGRLKDERRRAEEARTGAEAARALLSAERAAFVRDRAAQSAALETQVAEASRKLERDRMVLQRESRAMLQIPGRKERAEMEELRAELAGVREEMKARDVRAKTNADRLKRRVDELTSENEALKEEVRRAEAARLAAEDAAAVATASARRAAAASGHNSAAATSRDSDGSTQRQRGPKTSQGAAPAVVLPSADDIARAAGVRGIDYAAGLSTAQRRATTAAPGAGDAPSSEAGNAHAAPAEQERHDGGDVLDGCVWSVRPQWDDVLIDDSALGNCISETLHPDGRRERVFARGGRDVLFPNGTRKVAPPGGNTVVVAFANGDIKRTQESAPSGSGGSVPPDVWYYYAAVDTWHCTRGATGVEVFHFPTGQVEAHAPDGRKDILFPDGTSRRVHPDGREEELTGSSD